MKNYTLRNIILFITSAIIVVYFMPKNITLFNYKYTEGKPWSYDALYSPFDFLIRKSKDEIKKEKLQLEKEKRLYFKYDVQIRDKAIKDLSSEIESDKFTKKEQDDINKILNKIYSNGIIKNKNKNAGNIVSVIKNNEETDVLSSDMFNLEDALNFSSKELDNLYLYNNEKKQLVEDIFHKILVCNLTYDKNLTEKILKEKKDRITLSKGKVLKNSKVVEKGEIVDDEIFKNLESINYEYKNKSFSGLKYYMMILGYTILIVSVFGILFLFLSFYHNNYISSSSKKTALILSIILFIFFLSLLFLKIGTYEGINMVYMLPVCILPILIRTFFNYRISLLIHIGTLLLVSIPIKDSYEFFYMNILAGVVSILGSKEIHKRANLFVSVGKITIAYSVSFYCILLIKKGGIELKDLTYIIIFLGNGILTLFVLPLIYIYEKVFKIISDISLLELTDTNSSILRKLSLEAPGTFQHSLQVANIAENVARQINGNTLLMRAGALYHDIGKLKKPEYFTENQHGPNPHNKISPLESAKIIINHRNDGLIMANEYNLPSIIKKFIASHHGTSLVYFFYKKYMDEVGENNVDKKDFTYPGPIPSSKEMAILMMSDSIEAASKSLEAPTEEELKNLVYKIIDGQVASGQFKNTDITFKEIETAKKSIIESLKSIYKNRIKYPD